MLPALPHDLPPAPADCPLTARIREIVARPAVIEARGVSTDGYLDVMEPIVRVAATWRRDDGAVIDPHLGAEHGQTSPRFAAPGAILLAAGRCEDLTEAVYTTLDYSCRRLAAGEAASPDFWMRELCTAYHCLHDRAPAERVAGWAADIRAVVPETHYWMVKPDGDDLESLHNWTIYATAGEVMREYHGLRHPDPKILSGKDFWAKYMPAQATHMTALGMYRDPADPMTYDVTTRLQISMGLVYGIDAPARGEWADRLALGGLNTLLFSSPDGLVPPGGRSAEYHFREAIVCAVCELEARRWRDVDPAIAGAFRHQARLSLDGIQRWLTMSPWRNLKNGYPPEDCFANDPYGHYSVYSLLCASFLGLAAQAADPSIPALPCPAACGGYILAIQPEFHKVFASVADSQVVLDTAADSHYDATGMLRFTRRGVPVELGPGVACAAEPKYRLPDHLQPRAAAFAPAWPSADGWQYLAELSDLTPRVETLVETAARCAWRLHWPLPAGALTEHYELRTGGRLIYRCSMAGQPALQLRLPLLLTDGDAEATIRIDGVQATVTYRDASLTATFPGATSLALDPTPIPSRHGLHHLLTVTFPTASATAELQLS